MGAVALPVIIDGIGVDLFLGLELAYDLVAKVDAAPAVFPGVAVFIPGVTPLGLVALVDIPAAGEGSIGANRESDLLYLAAIG